MNHLNAKNLLVKKWLCDLSIITFVIVLVIKCIQGLRNKTINNQNKLVNVVKNQLLHNAQGKIFKKNQISLILQKLFKSKVKCHLNKKRIENKISQRLVQRVINKFNKIFNNKRIKQ